MPIKEVLESVISDVLKNTSKSISFLGVSIPTSPLIRSLRHFPALTYQALQTPTFPLYLTPEGVLTLQDLDLYVIFYVRQANIRKNRQNHNLSIKNEIHTLL